MVLPDDFKEIVAQDRRRLDNETKPLMEFEPVLSEDSDSANQNLDWELIDATEYGIEFKLVYKEPLEVSQGEIPDKLKLRFNLEQFTDEYG